MHEMNDKIELSAADKARLVLEATWRGKRWKRAPLDDKAAEALGRNLESAAQITGANPSFPLCELKNIEVLTSRGWVLGDGDDGLRKGEIVCCFNPEPPPHEIECLDELSKALEGVKTLLRGLHPATRERISQFQPVIYDDAARLDLRSMETTISDFIEMVDEAKDSPRWMVGAADLFGSLTRQFIECLCDIYLKYTGKKPATSLYDGVAGGPFVRFINEVYQQFCEGAAPPSVGTIKRAIIAWRERKKAREAQQSATMSTRAKK
jgi:hypothetical protein